MDTKEKTKDTTAAKEFFIKILQNAAEGKPLYPLYGLNKSHMECIYKHAFTLYKEEKYGESLRSFQRMALYDNFDDRGWMGAGLCNEKLARYNQAIECYSSAAMINPKNLDPILHKVICYQALDNYPQAIKSLELAIYLTDKNSSYAKITSELTNHLEDLKTTSNTK